MSSQESKEEHCDSYRTLNPTHHQTPDTSMTTPRLTCGLPAFVTCVLPVELAPDKVYDSPFVQRGQ